MKHKLPWLIVIIVLIASLAPAAQGQSNTQPTRIRGTYFTTYYADFSDWDIFPVLLPMLNADSRLHRTRRFDLREGAQITGAIRGTVEAGEYLIELPADPVNAGWFDTDGDPATPSDVKLFVVGTGSGIVSEEYVSPYDFIYTSSFAYNPNTRLAEGRLLVWSAVDGASFPVLNGADNTFYTPDDGIITVPAGWSILEITPDPVQNTETVRFLDETEPVIPLREPTQLEDVNLTELSYAAAFDQLLLDLENTYIFTAYRGVDWQNLRQQFASKAAEVHNDQEFHSLLEAALFSFRDGHLAIIGPGIPEWYFGLLGMQVYPVKGELMVIETYHPSPAADESNIVPGTVITAVNGMDAISFFNSIPRTIYSTGHDTQDLWYRGSLAFRGTPGTIYHIAYRLPDGQTGEVDLGTNAISQVGGAYTASSDPLTYQILNSGAGYIRINNFTSGSVDDLWDEAMDAMLSRNVPGIVIDLRYNGGGFSTISNYMFGDFLDEDMIAGQEISALDEDGDGKTDIQMEYYYGRQRVFDPGKLIVLVGPNCFSACEFAAQGFRDLGARVVGHLPSGGAGGGVGASYFLPGGTRVYGMAVVMNLDPDGNVLVEGTGIQPDVIVPFTSAGLSSGEDLLLTVAQDLLLTP